MRRSGSLLAAVAAALLTAAPAAADRGSLYRGPGPRPGPAALYAKPARAPQLTNAAPFAAKPILVSGASAYRAGEFLYQDFLYDDHGARLGQDPTDPSASADTFSKPNGTYTYPTDPVYGANAADLVELRVKPTADATLFRLTLNTLHDAGRVAATIAIGSSATPRLFPFGANATAPAQVFLTVHGATADLRDALTGLAPAGGAPSASVDARRRQITVSVPRSAWNPGTSTVRLAAGVGLWDQAAGRYLIPGPSATASTPGGAGVDPLAPAFFNVAFRGAEPLPEVSDTASVLADPSWWRDKLQGNALRTGDLSPFHTDVDFGKLAAGTTDDSQVPETGAFDRILASRYEPSQGVDYTKSCQSSAGCEGELRGRLQPYAIYVPKATDKRGRRGLTLLLHSLGANYNQFAGSRNQAQFGDRTGGHVIITPTGRGPDGWYYDHAGADTFEVWADVARRYRLDPARTDIAGYSMGGYGTYKFASQFPDLFARAQPTVGPPGLGIWAPPNPPQPGGDQSLTFRQLASLRHIPFLIWDAVGDQLVPYPGPVKQAQGFDELGYRYEFDSFAPADHLALAANDQFAPAAAFLGNHRVHRNPAHVTFVRNPTMDFAEDRTKADHAYWLSGIRLRDGSGPAPLGSVDARSRGFGRDDAPARAQTRGSGTLPPGNLGTIAYTSQQRTWGKAPRSERANALRIRLTNVRRVTVHPKRARLTCAARVTLRSDGPAAVKLAGCHRTVRRAR
ncbi:MAG TPA: glucodextranase DOMON-like domain-containing protein [Solirubrobacteraceae bacterium]|nr:glucodextranase DOMON-like domain-containing protein [Solirubrobacteraceae bacterium]